MPRPNMLFIMCDQMVAALTGAYGHPVVQTPNLDRLCRQGIRFDSAYTPFPVCSPARACTMAGRHASEIGAWDNGALYAADQPSMAHYLSNAGYDTVMSDKMHFIGPDQLHGFREQLARDLHAEMWTRSGVPCGTADWSKGTPPAANPWGVVAAAGPGTTLEIEVDDLVEERALEYLRDPERKAQLWALNVL